MLQAGGEAGGAGLGEAGGEAEATDAVEDVDLLGGEGLIIAEDFDGDGAVAITHDDGFDEEGLLELDAAGEDQVGDAPVADAFADGEAVVEGDVLGDEAVGEAVEGFGGGAVGEDEEAGGATGVELGEGQ